MVAVPLGLAPAKAGLARHAKVPISSTRAPSGAAPGPESDVTDGTHLSTELQESADDLRSYLADGIPPLLAAGGVGLLLRGAPQALTAQIEAWLSYQHQARGGTVRFADLVFHALRKLHLLGELGLTPKKELAAYLSSLVESLVPLCPPQDRELVRGSLERLRRARQEVLGTGFRVGSVPGGPGVGGEATPPELTEELRRFSLLLSRLKPAAAAGGSAGPPGSPGLGPGEDLVSALLSSAASSARDASELGEYLEHLRGLGVASTDPAVVVRTLSRALPAWAPAAMPEPEAMGGNARALRRFVDLAEAPQQRLERFQEVLHALVEEFNSGSLPRAVALSQVATSLLAEQRVPAGDAALVRSRARDSLDGERLRTFALDARQQPLLRQLMEFFPELQPEGLLVTLEDQPDRLVRRLCLTLLELYGEVARPAVLDRLESSLADTRETAWFWQRNLIYLLHRLPCSPDSLEERELDGVLQFSELAYHARLVGEAVIRLGQIRHPRAEGALLARLREVEDGLEAGGLPNQPLEDLERLRVLITTQLLRGGSSAARRTVVQSALARLRQTGEGDRVAELRVADLSAEPDLVDEILRVLREGLPRRLLGVTLPRKTESLTQIVEGLASTPTTAVRQGLEAVVQGFPREPYGIEASKVLAAFDAPAPTAGGSATPEAEPEGEAAEPSTQRMEGDLRLFGLPNLLQSFGQSELTGSLTLRDGQGATVALLELDQGRLVSCSTGRLQAEAAFYQLLELPLAKSFSFVGGEIARPAAGKRMAARDMMALLMEGMRRNDEYQRARALVPDPTVLVPTGTRPTSLPGETDGVFVRELWGQVKAGATAAACEETLAVDAYRVRALLSHWLTEGAVEVSQFGLATPAEA